MLFNLSEEKLATKIKRYSDVRIIGLLIFALIVLMITWNGMKVMQTNYELQKKEAELRQKNDIKKLENENIQLKNAYFETDQYLELTARRQFNKAAPGEKLYLIPESVAMSKTVDLPKTTAETIEHQRAEKSKYQQNFEAWLDFLFRR